MNTALVRLTVTAFRDVATSLGSISVCTVGKPEVLRNARRRVSVRGDNPWTIVVAGSGPVGLQFEVVSRRGSRLRATGIMFVQVAGGGDPLGRKNFHVEDVRSNTITVTDTWASHGTPGCAPAWKFFLSIRDGSDATGLIDPEVQNED